MSVAKNVVMGVGTLKNPRTVLDSVIIGSLAGHEHKVGERNVFIGNAAGFAANGTDNIYVGTGAGSTTQGSGNIILGPNILEPTLNNTFIVGQGLTRPITAHLDTGAVAIPHLEVGSLNVKGAFYASLPSNLVKTDRTNVGNVPCIGQYMVNFGTSNTSEGYQSVLLGDHAHAGTTACNVVAIGTRAAFRNTGTNVVAIGKGAGEFNTRDNMTYIGSTIECSPDTFTVKGKSANLGGWNLYTNDLSTEDIHITSEKIQFGSTTIEGTALDNGLLTGPITVKKHLPRMLETLLTLRKDGVYVGDVKVRAPFKELIRHAKVYYGLAGDGHVYTSTTGHMWRPIRSPSLEQISTDEETVIGFGKGQFYRLEGHEWILEPRDGGHAYQCFHLCGGYALGTSASNSFYEDEGTVMYRAGQEWRLFPGVYPETFTSIGDGPGSLYAGNEEGLYKLENRTVTKLNDDPVTFIAGRGYGTRDQFKFLGTQKSIKTFDAPLKYISKDQFAVTSEGVISLLDSRVRMMGSGIVRAFGDRGIHKESDVTLPEALRIGNFRVSTNRGIELHDGVRTSKVYDTVHNPLPIHLAGIANLTVKKSSCGGLELEVEDESGVLSWIALGSLQSNGRSNTEGE
jgi:hypothetical protein